MNIKKHHIITSSFLFAAIVFALIPLTSQKQFIHAAAGTQIYLTPANSTITAGSNLTLSIIIDTGGASVNTVQSVISYPSNYSFVSITPGSAFGTFPYSNSNGSTSFAAASTTPITSTQTVAILTLHSTNSGATSINLASVCPAGNYALTCSAAYDSVTSNNDLASVLGGNYIIAAVTPPPTPNPTTPPSPSPSPTPSNSGNGTHSTGGLTTLGNNPPNTPPPSSTPTSSNQDTAPLISDIKVTNIKDNSATISWTTNIPTDSSIQYGLDSKYGLFLSDNTLTTTHQINLGQPYLTKGTSYFYTIISKTTTGTSASSSPQQFTTTGFDITISVVDANGKPIVGAKVTEDGQTGITDSSGNVTFHNIPAGNNNVLIKFGNVTTTKSLSVGKLDPKSGTYMSQHFVLASARGTSNNIYYIISVIALIAAGITLYLSRNFIKKEIVVIENELNHRSPSFNGKNGMIILDKPGAMKDPESMNNQQEIPPPPPLAINTIQIPPTSTTTTPLQQPVDKN